MPRDSQWSDRVIYLPADPGISYSHSGTDITGCRITVALNLPHTATLFLMLWWPPTIIVFIILKLLLRLLLLRNCSLAAVMNHM